ncbi:MAG: sigma-70 family RNA polymerase sigma factor [Kofleriaceae bacterium]|nr:sigma-70 family RNA polymerase sigma factor [Kofleriaceae bacterium]
MGQVVHRMQNNESGSHALVANTPSDWGVWIKKHHHRLVLSLLAMSVPLHHAEEIAQSTWERLIQKEKSGQLDRIEMPGLALAQARFLALEYLRKELPATSKQEIFEETTLVANAPNPLRSLVSRSQMDTAQECLARASESGQTVFRLFYIEGLSAKEIGEEVGLSPQRVRQTLCELRADLRSAIGELCHD